MLSATLFLLLLRQQRNELHCFAVLRPHFEFYPLCLPASPLVLASDRLPLLTFYRLNCQLLCTDFIVKPCVPGRKPVPRTGRWSRDSPPLGYDTPWGASDLGGRLPPIWSCAQLPIGREALAYYSQRTQLHPGLFLSREI
jgi:hypothetical protein